MFRESNKYMYLNNKWKTQEQFTRLLIQADNLLKNPTKKSMLIMYLKLDLKIQEYLIEL